VGSVLPAFPNPSISSIPPFRGREMERHKSRCKKGTLIGGFDHIFVGKECLIFDSRTVVSRESNKTRQRENDFKKLRNIFPRTHILRRFLQLGDDHALHAVRCRLRTGSVDGNALSVDQEFCVIPLDFIGEPASFDSLQVFVEGMSVIAVDVDFSEHIKGEAILFLHSCLDFRVSARLLAGKLVAGEGGNTESISFVFFVQSLELMVVGVGQTSVGSYINYYYDFPSVFFSELDESSIDIRSFKLID